MPKISEHQSNRVVKMILLGDSKVGKTTALKSLLMAGYRLFILDMDNLLDPLKNKIMEECPELADKVDYVTLRDKRKPSPTGMIIDGPPTAFLEAHRMLYHWRYDDVDMGKPAEWGPGSILVIDSLSRLCDAAFDWRIPLTPRGKGGEYDSRATYGDAQDAIENILAGITSASYDTNIIVICHGQYMDLPDGRKKIFPQGVGQKLSPKIPQYFPNYVRMFNQGGQRLIQLNSDSLIDLAVAKAVGSTTLPAETGLATLFKALTTEREIPEPLPEALRPQRPQTLTLRKRT